MLIALAVFISVMGGVALLFVNSMRVTRQGFLNQEAYEEAQSALKLIERDITRAFTARQYGDYYQFYGTPVGFTFVGLASPDDRPADNLARITYVVYRNDPLEQIRVDDTVQATYSLLRYVEPGRDTLDDFPVQWAAFETSPESGITLQSVIDDRVQAFRQIKCPDTFAADYDECTELFDRNREAIESAMKREFWIRMLAGGDDELPSAWDNQNVFENGLPVVDLGPRFRPAQDIGGEVNPIDTAPGEYVVTERLVNVVTAQAARSESIQGAVYDDILINQPPGVQTDAPIPTAADRYFFTYGEFIYNPVEKKVRAHQRAFWNDWRNLMTNTGVDVLNKVGSPIYPRIPARVTSHLTFFYPSPYAGVPDFIQTFDQSIDIPAGYRRYAAE